MYSRLGSTGMKISFEISNPNYGLGMLLKTGEISAKISATAQTGDTSLLGEIGICLRVMGFTWLPSLYRKSQCCMGRHQGLPLQQAAG